MGFEDGRIILDSPSNTYFAGQTLHGKIEFSLDKTKTFRGIYVKVKGTAEVHWTTSQSRRVGDKTENYTVHHNANEEYFNIKQYLIGSGHGENHLNAGQYSFPFQCHIPPNCPSNFDGDYGKVRYEITVVVDRAFKIDQEKKIYFGVIAPFDLNQDPYSKEPMVFDFDDTFCSWCVSAGNYEATIKLPYSGFCPGQTIPIEISCNNRSSVDIQKIKIILQKSATFRAHHEPGTRTGNEEVIAELKKGPIPGNTTRNWSVDLELPNFVFVNLLTCGIIDLKYEFKVEVVTSGCHSNSDQSRKIIIGSVPIVGFQDNVTNQYPVPPQPAQNEIGPSQYQEQNQAYPGTNSAYPGNNQYQPGPTPYPSGYLGNNQFQPGPAPYPANPPYPGANPPYPGANPPYVGTAPPYTGINPPYPIGAPPYPAAPPYDGVEMANPPKMGFRIDDKN